MVVIQALKLSLVTFVVNFRSVAPVLSLSGFDTQISPEGDGETLALEGGARYIEMSAHMQQFTNGLTKKS